MELNNQSKSNKKKILHGMVLIPGGNYIMGKDINQEADYSPAHEVQLDPFYLDVHEVTNAQYYKFCQETQYELPEYWGTEVFRSGLNFSNYPVVGVNWSFAKEFAEWADKRLPTEAEWEYAARGGLIGKDFPTGNDWNVQLRRNIPGKLWQNLIVEVKNYEPNAYGLYDMSGNVWEWVADIYNEKYYSKSPKNNPKGPEKGVLRVIRGGSWHSGVTCKKVYFRKALPSNWVDFALGFRCAKDI